jgi:hypothetical protein
MKTLEITNTDDFLAIQMVADFGTLLGTYSRGFAVIIEPYDERLPHIPDPVLQLRWAWCGGDISVTDCRTRVLHGQCSKMQYPAHK